MQFIEQSVRMMTQDSHQILLDFKPSKEFFIGFDSDGCVFDTMEIKHKECFCPQFIKHFGLQKISKYARESWEFVNLYSKTRGTNRFKSLVRSVDLLKERKAVKARNCQLPDLTVIKDWISKESKLGNVALEKYVSQNHNEVMQRTFAWSKEVNKVIEEMVFDVPPFPYVIDSLEKIKDKSDIIVVSQTPFEALKREWEEHKIDGYIKLIAGQELGTKAEHLKYAAKGKYPDDKILMVGDSPGDYDAAKSNGVLFFPVIPGSEEDSWERFFKEGLDRFFTGSFKGEYENKLIDEFESYLPDNPNWQ